MAKRNLQYVIGADISGAKRGFKSLGAEVSGIRASMQGLSKTMMGLAGVTASIQAIRALGGSFITAATQMEGYQAKLRAVIKDSSAADKTFRDIFDWAARNPIDTDEAIGAFVALKAAAVKNSEEAIRAIGDISTVMQKDMRDVAQAIVSTEVEPLRNIGVLLDRTGKQAIIQSGDVRVAVSKDIDSIRAGIIKVIGMNFGGAMKSSADTLSGSFKTIGGLWSKFETDLMGSAGSGGPFDTIKEMVIDVRDAWDEWTRSTKYAEFLANVQYSAKRALESLKGTGETIGKVFGVALENIDKVISALKGLAGYKVSSALLALAGVSNPVAAGIAATGAALVYLSDQYPVATDAMSKIGDQMSRLEEQSKTLRTALKEALNLGNESYASQVAKELGIVQSKISQLKEEADALNAAVKMAAYDNQAVQRQSGSRIAGAPAAPKGGGGAGGGTGKSGGKSAAESLVENIQRQMKHLYADGASFLPLLDRWGAKLKPLSKDWEKIKTLQSEIRADLSRKVGEETAAAMERAKKAAEELKEAQDAAAEGVQTFWGRQSEGNSLGLLPDPEYLRMLQSDFAAMSAELQNVGLDPSKWDNWTEPMRARFAELQAVAVRLATIRMDSLDEQLGNGTISTAKWKDEVAKLREEYEKIPGVITKVDERQKDAKNTSDQFGISAKLWANDLSKGLADAIVNAEDLGDALSAILKQLASSALQSLFGKIFGSIFGAADGAAFSGGRVLAYANGGVVSRPTLFPMASGMGLMGEAGPEAIMPLRRGADGRLGVEGAGGGTTVVNHFHIQAIDSRSFAEVCARNPQAIASVVAGNYQGNGMVRRVIKGS